MQIDRRGAENNLTPPWVSTRHVRHSDPPSQVSGEGWTVGTDGPEAGSALRWAGTWDDRHQTSDIKLTLPARAENVALVRHVMGSLSEALGLPRHVADDLRLAVTEACTNIVRHAYAPEEPGPLDIVVRPEGDGLQIIVADQGSGIGPSADTAGPGLGLGLIAALTDRLEVDHAPGQGSRLSMWFARQGATHTQTAGAA